MTITVATKLLVELLTDALHTADDYLGIHIGAARAPWGDEPGDLDMLTATSSGGFVIGHSWVPCIESLPHAAVWPTDAARNVLTICKSLARTGSEDQQHTIDISLERAPIVDGVTKDGEHPGWTVTVQETPALFDSDTEFQFHAHPETRFPAAKVAELLAGGYVSDVRYKAVPLTQWSATVLKPIVAVAARRKKPIQMYRRPGSPAHLVQIGDTWLGAAMAQLPNPEQPVDGPSVEAVLAGVGEDDE